MSTNKQPCRLLSRRIRLYSWLFVVGNLCFPVQAEPFVINSAGSKVVGSAIRSEPDGTVLLTTLNGQTLTFRPGTYQTAFADKPKEMFQVEAMARQGDLDGAAGILRRVKEQYLFLGWDQRAGLMLARVELAREKFEDAAAEYESLFAAQPKFKAVPAERSRYMQALLGAGRIRETAELIDEDIASGSREAAARAQVVRGDMKLKSGQTEEALLDYLRTVLLFREQTDVLPEATYKTAAALKKMNDPRAADYFQQVIREFPESEFAESAQRELTADNADLNG
jgi:outer membrane protein assembly factor BamD (BamD/ComL family)